MKDQGEWLKQLGELQQQYWNGWREMSSQAMGAAPAPATPWQDGMEAWARAMGLRPQMPANPFFPFAANAFAPADPLERMLEQGKRYLGVLQGMMTGDAFGSMQGDFDPRAWLEQMRDTHERIGQDLLGKMEPMPWFTGLQAAQVEQLVKTFTGMPARGMKEELQSWLATPAFGLNREHQERVQALASAWLDYLEAQKRYDALMMESARRTFDILESRFAGGEEPGRQIETARALYDLWIDAAEEAFGEVAMSAEYRDVYGELVNTQMRVRAGINREIERIGEMFGLPTRTEVDSLARQLHELRRELRRSGRTAGAAGENPAKAAPAFGKPAARPPRKAKPRAAAGKSAQLVAAPPTPVATRAANAARRPAARKQAGTAKGTAKSPAASTAGVTPVIQNTAARTRKRG